MSEHLNHQVIYKTKLALVWSSVYSWILFLAPSYFIKVRHSEAFYDWVIINYNTYDLYEQTYIYVQYIYKPTLYGFCVLG